MGADVKSLHYVALVFAFVLTVVAAAPWGPDPHRLRLFAAGFACFILSLLI